MNNIYKNAIECLPMFFDIQLQFDPHGAGIFEPLRKIINFDQGYIFFLNPDSIQLKYLFGKDRECSIGDSFPINSNLKDDLFSESNMIFDSEYSFAKLLKLEDNKSFLTLKLIIRNTVYGFVLLCKNESCYYKPEDINISTAIGSFISYKIKDIELSEIFKIQLKALKDSVVETKAAYKIIKEQNVKILESDKIKNEFLANVSHGLRTPLNAIIGFSEVLSNGFYGSLNEKQLEFVKDINLSGINLLEMINEILDISKIEAKAMTLNETEFLLSQAVEEVVNIVKPLADKKSISIHKNLSKNKTIFADFQKIRQVLYNLLSNAIKYSPDKGTIEVNAEFNNDNFIIEIKDNGIGIAPKDQDKIFEKFVQLENAYTKKESSTGLGLTITKELVEMHNGEITIKSDIGKGTTFIVKIPIINNVINLKRQNQQFLSSNSNL